MRFPYPIYRNDEHLFTLCHDHAGNRFAIVRISVADGISGAGGIVTPWQSIKITKAARRLRLYAEEHELWPVFVSGFKTERSVSAATLSGARKTNQGHSITELQEVQA